jgi:glycosyltransferase involved in cell wall biosynthesis
MNELISILSPAYNCAPYLWDMIKSMQSQSYSNWELIIVDDGSTDSTYDTALELSRYDQRIRVLRIPHGGHAVAFNCAWRHARGEVIARQDADDYSSVDRLLLQLQQLKETGADLCTCQMYRVYPNGRKGQPECTGMDSISYIKDPVPHGPVSASIVALRHVYTKLGGFNTEQEGAAIGGADSEWNFRALAFRPKFIWTHIPQALYVYRQHAAQCTKTDRGAGQRDHERNQKTFRDLILQRMEEDANA